ncbi:hypothetical protein PMIN03_011464 [Paraphaeosphaeria minitans]
MHLLEHNARAGPEDACHMRHGLASLQRFRALPMSTALICLSIPNSAWLVNDVDDPAMRRERCRDPGHHRPRPMTHDMDAQVLEKSPAQQEVVHTLLDCDHQQRVLPRGIRKQRWNCESIRNGFLSPPKGWNNTLVFPCMVDTII